MASGHSPWFSLPRASTAAAAIGCGGGLLHALEFPGSAQFRTAARVRTASGAGRAGRKRRSVSGGGAQSGSLLRRRKLSLA